MDRDKILEELEELQDDVWEHGFAGSNERELWLRENIADYIVKNCSIQSVNNRFSDPKFIYNVCLSYRHDFGLLSEHEQNKVRLECKEWMRAIKNNEPY